MGPRQVCWNFGDPGHIWSDCLQKKMNLEGSLDFCWLVLKGVYNWPSWAHTLIQQIDSWWGIETGVRDEGLVCSQGCAHISSGCCSNLKIRAKSSWKMYQMFVIFPPVIWGSFSYLLILSIAQIKLCFLHIHVDTLLSMSHDCYCGEMRDERWDRLLLFSSPPCPLEKLLCSGSATQGMPKVDHFLLSGNKQIPSPLPSVWQWGLCSRWGHGVYREGEVINLW